MQPSTLRALLADLHEAEELLVYAFQTKEPRERIEKLRAADDLFDAVHERMLAVIERAELPPANSEGARGARFDGDVNAAAVKS